MAGEEIFIANSILIIPMVLTFLLIYILNKEKNQIIGDAGLIGVFITLLYGVRVMDRAFNVLDPYGELDLITGGFFQVFIWIIIIIIGWMFVRLLLNFISSFKKSRDRPYGKFD